MDVSKTIAGTNELEDGAVTPRKLAANINASVALNASVTSTNFVNVGSVALTLSSRPVLISISSSIFGSSTNSGYLTSTNDNAEIDVIYGTTCVFRTNLHSGQHQLGISFTVPVSSLPTGSTTFTCRVRNSSITGGTVTVVNARLSVVQM